MSQAPPLPRFVAWTAVVLAGLAIAACGASQDTGSYDRRMYGHDGPAGIDPPAPAQPGPAPTPPDPPAKPPPNDGSWQKPDRPEPAADKPSRNPACNVPITPTPCMMAIRAVRYDPTRGVCAPASYSGCGRAANDFATQAECERACL